MFMLVNDNVHEAMTMSRRMDASGPSWLLLPGAGIASDSAHYEVDAGRSTIPLYRRSADWFRDAHLMIVGWTTEGVYTADLRADVP
jgi:hypothetical protein